MSIPASRHLAFPFGGFLPIVLLWAAFPSPVHSSDPVLKPNDSLSLDVFGEENLSRKTSILKSGEAVFPLIGSVPLAGLTLSAATEKVRNLYNKDYLVEPKLNLTVENYAQEFITIAGAVNTPGPISIPASGNLDLSVALSSSGGLSPKADKERITVTRATGESSTYTEAQLRKGGAVIQLQPGDKVLVDESRFVGKTIILQGRINRPGEMSFPLDGKLDIVTAIAKAGGLDALASPRKVEVNRKGKVTKLNIKELSEKGSTRFFLQPDDIITVGERIF